MTDFNAITYDGKTNNYTKEKFEFQLNKEKNAMVFGKGGWFHASEYLLYPLFTYLDRDGWASEDGIAHILYSEGVLLKTSVTIQGIYSIRATCDNSK